MMTSAHDKAAAILESVAEQFGIKFSSVGTGGGCMALEARLESGHWIVATDEGLCGFVERVQFESNDGEDDDDYQSRYGGGGAMGWSIGIYPNHDIDGIDTWMNGGSDDDTLVDVVDYDVFADSLPEMVGRALAALAQQRRVVIDEYTPGDGARIRVRRPGFYY